MRIIVNDYLRKNIKFLIFYLICTGGCLSFVACAWKYGFTTLHWLVMGNDFDWTGLDYYLSILFYNNLDTIYNGEVYYPPLVTLFFYYISRITYVCFCDDRTSAMAQVLSSTPYQIMIYNGYLALGVASIVYAIGEYKISAFKKITTVFFVLCSAPMFAGALERGNTVLFAVGFLLLAFAWRDSSDAIKREMALVLIALSAGIKLYPAVAGILYLKEKRYKEAIRLIIYGIVCIFSPFVVLGKTALANFLRAIAWRNDSIFEGRIQFFKGLITILVGDSSNMLVNVSYYFFIIILIAFLWKTKSKLCEYTYLAVFMSVVPGNAYRFTLLFWLLPLLIVISMEDEHGFYYILYAIAISCVFAVPTVAGVLTNFSDHNYPYPDMTYVEFAIYIPIWILTFGTVLWEAIVMLKEFSIKVQMKKTKK